MADDTTLAELFARDPMQLTVHEGGDIDRIIAHYVAARKQFLLGDKSAGATKKLDVIDLSELGL